MNWLPLERPGHRGRYIEKDGFVTVTLNGFPYPESPARVGSLTAEEMAYLVFDQLIERFEQLRRSRGG